MSDSTMLTQEVVLPSRGLLNPEIPEGKIVQRCMLVKDQKFLAGGAQKASDALNEIIRRTIVSPEGVDLQDLTITDTMFLLFKLRQLSYGDTYKFYTRCPECGKRIQLSVDLSQLEVTTLDEDYESKLTVVLPRRGDTVHVKILTNRDTAETDREIKRRRKRNPNDDSAYVLRIVAAISKIDLKDEGRSITHPIDIEKYVESLTDYDAAAITHARDLTSFGLDTVVEEKCPECGEIIEVGLNFSGEFFRPSFE